MRYLKTFKDLETIEEAIIDIPKKSLSDIFDTNDKVCIEVKSTIEKGIDIIRKQFPDLKIVDYYVVGAAVTYQYGEGSDIDTTVVLDPSTNKDLMGKADKWIEVNLDNKYFHRKRPYQFKLSFKTKSDLNSVDSAYDIQNDQWLKKPNYENSVKMFKSKVSNSDSEENKIYAKMEKFVKPSLEKLYKSLIDKSDEETIKKDIIFAYSRYGEYSKLYTNVKVDKKKEGFIKKFRNSAYEKDTELGYVSQNWGKGNVIYKMFDEEGYISVFEILKKIIKYNKFIETKILDELKTKLEIVINDEIGYKP